MILDAETSRAGQVAAFVPANIPICMGMLMTPPTLGNVLFWQWMNQSYNAGFNYSNRSVPVQTVKRLGIPESDVLNRFLEGTS